MFWRKEFYKIEHSFLGLFFHTLPIHRSFHHLYPHFWRFLLLKNLWKFLKIVQLLFWYLFYAMHSSDSFIDWITIYIHTLWIFIKIYLLRNTSNYCWDVTRCGKERFFEWDSAISMNYEWILNPVYSSCIHSFNNGFIPVSVIFWRRNDCEII